MHRESFVLQWRATFLRDSFKPVDYKEGERSNLVLSEFHHIVGTAFLYTFPMIFYFSGTGNSRWIANQLSKEQQEDLVFIPDALKNSMLKGDALKDSALEFSLSDDEKIGFVFPVYSWAPPDIVLRFIHQVSLKGYQNHYLFFVCSCGDDTGLTQQVFSKALAAKGWECHAGFSVTMPNNYVLLPGFDVDGKELEARKLEDAVPALDEINAKIKRREHVFSCHEGSFPFIKTRIINPLFNRFQMSPKHFYVTDACVGCRRCEKNCPVGNVMMSEGKPVWGMECTSCLACYHVCPQHAVQYGKRTKDKGQYINQNALLLK